MEILPVDDTGIKVLLDGSAGAVARAIRNGDLTRPQMIAATLDRIEQRNPMVNAICTPDGDRAMAAAWLADLCDPKRPLEGVPCTIKDTIETAGLLTTAGSSRLASHVPAFDAPAVRRLRSSGAALVGKTNVPPFAGDLQTENALFGRTRNPWRPDHTCGGSSGGSAASVAARLIHFDLGSDFAGSLRIPAAYCGVYAHRPTSGIVSSLGHIPPMPGAAAERDLITLGPITRDAGDLALVMDSIAGPTGRQSAAWQLLLPDRERQPAAWAVALTLNDAVHKVETKVRAGIESLAGELEKAGMRVTLVEPPESLADINECFGRLLGATIAPLLDDERFDLTAKVGEALEDSYAKRDALAVCQSHRDWLQLDEWRANIERHFDRFFHGFDVWLCPVSPTTAPLNTDEPDRYARRIEVDGEPRSYFEQLSWTAAAPIARLPATVAPIGKSDGLPLAVQIVGRQFADRTTIEFAQTLADLGVSYSPPPGF